MKTIERLKMWRKKHCISSRWRRQEALYKQPMEFPIIRAYAGRSRLECLFWSPIDRYDRRILEKPPAKTAVFQDLTFSKYRFDARRRVNFATIVDYAERYHLRLADIDDGILFIRAAFSSPFLKEYGLEKDISPCIEGKRSRLLAHGEILCLGGCLYHNKNIVYVPAVGVFLEQESCLTNSPVAQVLPKNPGFAYLRQNWQSEGVPLRQEKGEDTERRRKKPNMVIDLYFYPIARRYVRRDEDGLHERIEMLPLSRMVSVLVAQSASVEREEPRLCMTPMHHQHQATRAA